MAPEIIRNQNAPNAASDMHSLAVLHFHILFMEHPFHGAKEAQSNPLDEVGMKSLYAENPVFMFHPTDESNRPVLGYHDNALLFRGIYPSSILDGFTRTFTDGVLDPLHGRVREVEWCEILQNALDAITRCPDCSAQNFYRAEKLNVIQGHMGACWNCRQDIPVPVRMRVGNRVVVLDENVEFYAASLDHGFFTGFTTPVAKVIRHPSKRHRIGLRNLGDQIWRAQCPNQNQILTISRDHAITLMDGMAIQS